MKLNPWKIAATAMAVATAAVVHAADWPMWGGSLDRNMINREEKNIVAEWDIASGKNVKWAARLGSQSYGNPVIADGRVYVGTNNGAERDPDIAGDKGVVMVFDEETGDFLYQAIHDKLPTGRVNDWPEQGICSTVAVDGDRFYYVSNRAQLVCADVEGFLDDENDGPYTDEQYSGERHADFIWVLDMIGELDVFPHNLATSSPLVDDDMVYVVTSNGVDEGHLFIPSPRAPSFIGVNKSTGEVVWENDDPDGNILHGQWSSPAYGEVDGKGQVYFPGGDGWLYALEPKTGEVIWKFDLNPKDSVWELGGRGTRNNIISTPVFHEGRVYLGVGQDPEHGPGDGHFYAIDASGTGDVTESGQVWHFGGIDRTMSTAAVTEDRVYIADLTGFLYCLDRATGKELWQYDTLAAVWSSPTVIGDKVYLGDEDGEVSVFEDAGEMKMLGEYSVLNANYTTPIAANGVLYLANRNTLYALEEGASFTGEPK